MDGWRKYLLEKGYPLERFDTPKEVAAASISGNDSPGIDLDKVPEGLRPLLNIVEIIMRNNL